MTFAFRSRAVTVATATALSAGALTVPFTQTAHAAAAADCHTDSYVYEVDDAITFTEGAAIRFNLTRCVDDQGQLTSGTAASIQADAEGPASILYEVGVTSAATWPTESNPTGADYDGQVILASCIAGFCGHDPINLTGVITPGATSATAESGNGLDWSVSQVSGP